MALIIKNGRAAADPWLRLDPAADGGLPSVPEAGDVIVPLALWRARRAQLLVRAGRLGVWLDSHEDPAAIAGDLGLLGVVAVNFPKLTDGRGYTTGRLLRERYGYKGELRAIGDVLRDTLFQLAACGFDAFALKPGEDPEAALAGLKDFSESYQSTVTQPMPLFRRRGGVSA